MSKKETIPLTCPCEKEHLFSETFLVAGAGQTRVQVRCPHGQCPFKNALLSFTIPFELVRDEPVFKGDSGSKPPKPQ
ncbi:MAG: hypothetical protein ACKVU2_01490 [Saprospiraceae bacterium]